MSSPLGLTSFSIPQFNRNGSISGETVRVNLTQGIGYRTDNGQNANDPNYSGSYNSIFNGSKFYYRPTISTDSSNDTNTSRPNSRSSKRHQSTGNGDDLYDISTNSIINYTSDPDLPAMTLKPSDFIYLKDFGVFPNNRLVVVRRFPSPVENDLTAVGQSPISTVVSWIPDDQKEFISFKANETWSNEPTSEPVKDLSEIFNDVIGKVLPRNPFTEMAGTGNGAFQLLPIGGITEAIQTTIINYFLNDGQENGTNFSYDNLHLGNPNFMGESSYRKMNSITSDISIKVKSTYEMKYINGIDPTIAFMDIIQNLLRFSSSQSVFYLSQAGGNNINKFINKFKNGDWIGAINLVLQAIINSVKLLVNDIGSLVQKGFKAVKDTLDGTASEENRSAIRDALESGLSVIGNSALARFRIEFSRIIPAMTGASSAPWHITVGNPKRPFFSSADMVVENSEVRFGNTLGFNDLPNRIDFEFTVKTARNLGIQEIFDRFNVGAGRQYQRNSIEFKTDFYQGSVRNTGTGSTTTTGANINGSTRPQNI